MDEIEYKYLVDKKKWELISKSKSELIVQGFIHKTENCVVRVRIKGETGYLTIKGKTIGITRKEFDYPIPLSDAEELISGFTSKHIRKQRYEVLVGSHTWEVDVFEGPLKGLIIAELEVKSEDEIFELPDWVTENVSLDPQYYNAVLIDKC